MGNRQAINRVLKALSATAAAITLCASVAASAQDRVVSSTRVAAVEHVDSELTLTWVFRAEDLFACQTIAYDLRLILGDFGDRVDVTALGVNTDPELLADFLRKERLSIRTGNLSEAQYRQSSYRVDEGPALYISRNGQRLHSVYASIGQRSPETEGVELYDLVAQLLAHPTQRVARAH